MVDLNSAEKNFSENHKKIANYIMQKIDVIPFMVEQDLAKECNVSVSSVSRFWRTIGFKNFKEFKEHLKEQTTFSPASKIKTAFDKMDSYNEISDSIMSGVNYIKETVDHLEDKGFKNIISAINECNTLHIYASGPAVCLSSLLEFRLRRFDFKVNILTGSGHELFEDLIHIKPEDVILIFGFVHESPEIKVLFDIAEKINCKTILITDLMVSPMLNKATYHIYAARGELWEFHSMVAPFALIESIIVAVGKERKENALNNLQRLQELRNTYVKLLPKKV
ncbi:MULTISPECIES: MurR/RpiR family transcriptional regulator [unclassified Clostridium]|uniref:MurR/RpiR family transcriptional regulator n=1 Tax=unclassified Clostridium TaxID=2614128 RepID=UPI000297DBDC|nr:MULTISPECIES: MurR/RpiR family transcriptional regulator [unclassified Clostridium]EKQ58050.1 MAG: transcriptional regulator [Clostridium sp. Maddingley MBC34-26]